MEIPEYIDQILKKWTTKLKKNQGKLAEVLKPEKINIPELIRIGKKAKEYRDLLDHLKKVIIRYNNVIQMFEPDHLFHQLLEAFSVGESYKKFPLEVGEDIDVVVIEAIIISSLKIVNEKIVSGNLDFSFEDGIKIYFTP